MLDSTGTIARPAASGPALPVLDTEAGVPAATLNLDQRLAQSADYAHRRARAEGWTWFRQDRYRRAARAFESATLLDPQDSEARIGEIFSYLAVGAGRTALAVFGELNRRDANPFVHQLNLADPGGDNAALREIRLGLRAQAQADNSNPDITALYALVLWYLGDKDEAMLTVANLARSFPGSGYADWPARMDAARKTPPADRDRT
jgi:thioredoxin-like negative regulator of GroEL